VHYPQLITNVQEIELAILLLVLNNLCCQKCRHRRVLKIAVRNLQLLIFSTYSCYVWVKIAFQSKEDHPQTGYTHLLLIWSWPWSNDPDIYIPKMNFLVVQLGFKKLKHYRQTTYRRDWNHQAYHSARLNCKWNRTPLNRCVTAIMGKKWRSRRARKPFLCGEFFVVDILWSRTTISTALLASSSSSSSSSPPSSSSSSSGFRARGPSTQLYGQNGLPVSGRKLARGLPARCVTRRTHSRLRCNRRRNTVVSYAQIRSSSHSAAAAAGFGLLSAIWMRIKFVRSL